MLVGECGLVLFVGERYWIVLVCVLLCNFGVLVFDEFIVVFDVVIELCVVEGFCMVLFVVMIIVIIYKFVFVCYVDMVVMIEWGRV